MSVASNVAGMVFEVISAYFTSSRATVSRQVGPVFHKGSGR